MATNMTPGPADARVIQTPWGFEVVPARAAKHREDLFIVRNNTRSEIRVAFPPDLQMSPPGGTIDPQRDGVFTIGNPDMGVYPYVVEIRVTDNRSQQFSLRASGGSDPEIIIDY